MNDTPEIEIHIETQYVPQESEPAQNRFVFAYTITITNCGPQPVQLLRRYWRILDANDKEQEVHGEGVVGKQPHIAVNDSFTYTSGAVLETPVGTMEGSYEFQNDDGTLFDAPIPAFVLADPGKLH